MGSKSYKMSIMLDICKSIIKSIFKRNPTHSYSDFKVPTYIYKFTVLLIFFLICFNETDDKYIFTKYVLVSLKNENPWRPFVYPPVERREPYLGL